MDTPFLENYNRKSLELDSDTQILIKQNEEIIPNFLRSYSEPYLNETSNRRQISQHVLLKIIELGLNVDLASQILDSIEPELFLDNSFSKILDQVVDQLLLFKDYQEEKDYKVKQNIYQQLRSVIRPKDNQLNENNRLSTLNDEQICGICLSPLQKDCQSLICQHKFCKECFIESFKNKIFNGQSDKMTCPEEDCEELISDEMIESLLGEKIKNKMNKFRKIKLLSKDSNIIQCPKIGCEEFIKKTQGQKKLICQCGELICPDCHRQYHPGSNCNQQMDKEFKIAVQTLYLQQCPKCKSHIQKNDGCNHMTCRQCQYEFCWLCRSKYSDKHYSTWNIFGCPDQLFAERTPFKYPNCYRFWIILGLIIFGPPLAIILLILGIIILILFLPIILYFLRYGEDFRDESSCYQFFFLIFWGSISIAISPISAGLLLLALAVGIIIGIPYLLYCLWECCFS